MPLADGLRRIALALEGARDGDLLGRQAPRRVLCLHPVLHIAGHAAANGQAPGEQRGAAGRADGSGDVEVREAHALAGHAVEVGRADARMTVATQVAVAQIVGQNDDQVGQLLGPHCRGRIGQQSQDPCQQEVQRVSVHICMSKFTSAIGYRNGIPISTSTLTGPEPLPRRAARLGARRQSRPARRQMEDHEENTMKTPREYQANTKRIR